MDAPIIGFCEGDLYIFGNEGEACAEIEPIDAKNSTWQVFDRNGQRLGIEIIRRPLSTWRPLRWMATEGVTLVETGQDAQPILEQRLRDYLEAIYNSTSDSNIRLFSEAPLIQLLDEASCLASNRRKGR